MLDAGVVLYLLSYMLNMHDYIQRTLIAGSRLCLCMTQTSTDHDQNRSIIITASSHVQGVRDQGCLTGDLDGLHLRLLDLGLGHGDREHAVLQPGLHLVRLGVLRQAEPAEELAAAALDAVPLVVLVLLPAALAADHQDVAVLHLHLDLLLLDAGEVGLEDVRLGGLLPVDARAGEGSGVAARRRRGHHGAEDVEGVPEVGEGVEHVAAPHQRHCCRLGLGARIGHCWWICSSAWLELAIRVLDRKL